MFSQIHTDGLVYISPEVEQILLKDEGVLCLSVPSGDGDNNGIDDLLPGENWGDLL